MAAEEPGEDFWRRIRVAFNIPPAAEDPGEGFLRRLRDRAADIPPAVGDPGEGFNIPPAAEDQGEAHNTPITSANSTYVPFDPRFDLRTEEGFWRWLQDWDRRHPRPAPPPEPRTRRRRPREDEHAYDIPSKKINKRPRGGKKIQSCKGGAITFHEALAVLAGPVGWAYLGINNWREKAALAELAKKIEETGDINFLFEKQNNKPPPKTNEDEITAFLDQYYK